MPTLEELEGFTKTPEQPMVPTVAAPASSGIVPQQAPVQPPTLRELAILTNPELDDTLDKPAPLKENLDFASRFTSGSFYKDTQLPLEEGRQKAEEERFNNLSLWEKAKEKAGLGGSFQDEPAISAARGFVNPLLDTIQLPGYLAKDFQESDVLGDNGVEFDYAWDKPMTSLLYGISDITQKFQNEFVNKNVDPNKAWYENIPEAAGSAAAFIAGGRASPFQSVAGQAGTAAFLGATSSATSQLEEAASFGASPEDQLLAAAGGAAFGATEGLPGAFFLKRLNKLTGGRLMEKLHALGMNGESGLLREAVKSALVEGGQEGFQTVGSNWVASDLAGYDPTRSLGENFWDSVFTGGLVGSFMGSGLQMLHDADLNKAKADLEAKWKAQLDSGDLINMLAEPGNGFGSFSPVENLVALNKLKGDLDRHIEQKAEYALQELEAKGQSIEGDLSGVLDPDIIGENFGMQPDQASEMQLVQPSMDQEDKFFKQVGGDDLVNTAVEQALPKRDLPYTVREALQHTPVVTLPSRFEALHKEVTKYIKSNQEFLEGLKVDPKTNADEIIKVERRLKMLQLRQTEFTKKLSIANALLRHTKDYIAAFRTAYNPNLKMFIRDSGMASDKPTYMGWFTGSQNVKLANNEVTPVAAFFIKLEPLVDEIYSGGAQSNTVAFKSAKRQIFEVINHELGHSILTKSFTDLANKVKEGNPEESRKAYKQVVLLIKEYRNWLQEMSGKSQYEFVGDSFAFQRGAGLIQRARGPVEEVLGEGIAPEITPAELQQTKMDQELPANWPKKDYLLSFDEFFAEMTARLATQGEIISKDGLNSTLTEFFRPVMNTYEKIFRSYPEFARNEYGNNWKEFLQARSLSAKVKEEIENVQASGSRNLWDGIRGKVEGLNPDNFVGVKHQLDRWNKGIAWGLNLLQMEQTFGHVPQFKNYRNTTEAWAEYQRDFADKATETLETWRGLGKKEHSDLAAVLYYEAEQGRNLTPKELTHALSGEALRVYNQIRQQLNRVLDEMMQTALVETNREHSSNQEKLATTTKEIQDEFGKLKESGYFPYVRFGNWTITARAKNSGTYLGKAFKEGELITFQAFESRGERDKEYLKLRNELGGGAIVSSGKMRESEYTVQGMPRSILLALRNRLEADGQLNEDVKKSIDQQLESAAPFKSFRNHFKKKQGIHGYSEDAYRTFAHYIRSAAGNISRVRYAGEMRESIDSMQASVRTIQEIGGDATSRQEMVHWLKRHFDYIMNPASELAALRGVGFVAYLGFNIKSAFVNTMQMFTTTYPYLAARYGDISAVAEMGKGGAWLKKWVLNKKDFIKAKPGSHEQRIAELIARGQQEGWLDQSLATELAIAASENSLDRSLYLPSGKRFWHTFSRWSAWPFHMVEKTNRYVTAIAAYNLNYNETGEHEKAVLAAKLANQQTHFENSRWNRPEFIRGKKSAAFLFTNFVQNQLFFIAKDPGAVRYFCIMFLLAGAMGLPGADDLVDTMDAAATKLNKELGMKNPKVQLRVEARKFLDELGANPDLVLHGVSQDSFGLGQVGELTGVPIPRFDLSRSLGMGNIIPGTEIPNMVMSGGKPGDIAMEAFSQAAGASGNLVEDYYRALFSNEPSAWKKMERLLPIMSVRNMSKAARYAMEGKERTANGVVIADFTPYDIRTGLEIFGQGLGFPIKEVQQGWEKEIASRDAAMFYKTWHSSIQRQLNIAYMQEDREAIADAREGLKAYNESVPFPEMKIKATDSREAVKAYIKSQFKSEAGFAAEKKYLRLTKSVEEAFPIVDYTEGKGAAIPP